jgi:MSHA biogenesis protein MshO
MSSRRARGVTLIELVVVIALIAIISAVAAIAIREPIQSYADTSRRAEMSDVADTALRRIGREVRGALPNSIRVISGATSYLELLPVRAGGRYRAETAGAADGLSFASTGDGAFNILASPSTDILANDILVVRNESATGTISNAYTYNQSGAGFNCTNTIVAAPGCNTQKIAATPVAAVVPNEYTLTLGNPRAFNYDAAANRGFGSPGNRFYAITPNAVTYVCAPNATLDASGDSNGTLRRVTGYGIVFTQPQPGGGDLVASNVSQCTFGYASNISGYTGLVVLRLSLTRHFETVSLYHEIHVNNAP